MGMKKAIQTAINIGETKAKAVALRARENLAAEKKALLSEITHTVEEMADKAFKVIQGHHGKIADNYLSLKAYAVSAEDAITKYVGHGKGKNLSSLGDLLTNVAGLSDVVVEKAEGLSPTGTLKAIFTGGEIEVDGTVSKVNGPGQVPAPEARAVHDEEGCPPGRQDRWQGWQLRLHEWPRSGSLQQA